MTRSTMRCAHATTEACVGRSPDLAAINPDDRMRMEPWSVSSPGSLRPQAQAWDSGPTNWTHEAPGGYRCERRAA